MDVRKLDLDEETFRDIESLQLKVELLEGKRFRALKSIEELSKLLEFSSLSTNLEIKQLFTRFNSRLDENRRAFFKTLGISLVSKNTLADAKKETSNTDAEKNKAPRNIMYRGSEKTIP